MGHPLDHLLWASPEYLDEQYRAWQADPSSVGRELAAFFANGFESGHQAPRTGAPAFLIPRGGLPDGVDKNGIDAGIQIYDLVHTYREYGHLIANIDPLGLSPREHPFLELDEFELPHALYVRRLPAPAAKP